MMSAAQNQKTMEAKLRALQCHFTWDLDSSRSKWFRLRDIIKDIGTEEGNSWLGHIYNLQGYIHYQLGFTEDAQHFFNRATEVFQMRNTVSDGGPWLVVNYGNLAWLHHHLGEQAESQTYLSKVNALLKEYPSPSQDKFHQEIYAEKAWTLMYFDKDKKQQAADYFERAIRRQPDVVEWHTSRVIALVNAYRHKMDTLNEDIFEEMTRTKKLDPNNLYLAALYLEECAKRGGKIKDEARELAKRVLRNTVSSYCGMTPLLRLFREHVSMDEAIDLVEEALEKHPDGRHLKRCAAMCYKWAILSEKYSPQSRIDRAIRILKEVISLYPHSSLKIKMSLANVYAKSNQNLDEAEQIYNELLISDLDSDEGQMLKKHYKHYLHLIRHSSKW